MDTMESMLRNRITGLVMMTVLLVIVTALAILTYTYRETHHLPGIAMFAIRNHIAIMIGLIVISIAFGYFWSTALYSQIRETKKQSKTMVELVHKFLSIEERKILKYLIEKSGKASQAEISKLQGLNRLRAFRSLQKMQEKSLISIESRGKMRDIVLSPEILLAMTGGDGS